MVTVLQTRDYDPLYWASKLLKLTFSHGIHPVTLSTALDRLSGKYTDSRYDTRWRQGYRYEIEVTVQRLRELKEGSIPEGKAPSEKLWSLFLGIGFGTRSEEIIRVIEGPGWNIPITQEAKKKAHLENMRNHISDMLKYRPYLGGPMIDTLGLSTPTFNSLWHAGIRYVQQLTDMPDKAFFRIRNMTKRGREEIKEKLTAYTFSLNYPPKPVVK